MTAPEAVKADRTSSAPPFAANDLKTQQEPVSGNPASLAVGLRDSRPQASMSVPEFLAQSLAAKAMEIDAPSVATRMSEADLGKGSGQPGNPEEVSAQIAPPSDLNELLNTAERKAAECIEPEVAADGRAGKKRGKRCSNLTLPNLKPSFGAEEAAWFCVVPLSQTTNNGGVSPAPV